MPYHLAIAHYIKFVSDSTRYHHHWKTSQLGYKDSNLEMLESESSALPFGDSPLIVPVFSQALFHYILVWLILQVFFLLFRNSTIFNTNATLLNGVIT